MTCDQLTDEEFMLHAFFMGAFAKRRLGAVMVGLLILVACENRPMTFRERPRGPSDRDDGPVGEGSRDREHSDSDDLNGAGGSAPRRTMEVSFPSHDVNNAAVDFVLQNEFVEQALTLERQYISQREEFTQLIRPRAEERFLQGFPDTSAREEFTQNGERVLDILLVVDNSASMAEEQQNLSTKIMPLLSSITQTNWRIGVVTTDPADTCLRALITKDDADAGEKFRRAVQAGIKGSGNERGILVAERSITGKCGLNNDWLRPNSTLAILIVSDEDNCSNGGDCGGADYTYASYLTNAMGRDRVLGSTARAYGLIRHPSQSRAECSTAEQSAAIYAEVINATGGTWGSICDEDYSTTLNAISNDIAVTLGTKFALRSQPKAASVVVKVNGGVIHDYKVVGNVVEFDLAPVEGAQIEISYMIPGKPMRQEFVLQETPAAWDTQVSVNGQVAAPSEYTIDLARKTVRFHAMPARNADITVSYIRDLPLTKEFKLQSSYKAGSLLVSVNGQVTADFNANEQTGVVDFFTAPRDGANIAFAYLKPGKALLSYPLAVPAEVENTLVVLDAQTQEEIGASYNNGVLSIDAGDFNEGRVLAVRYANPRRDQFTVELPQDPIPGTIELHDAHQICRDDLVVNGRVVDASGCGFRADIDAISAFYDYVTASHQNFTLRLDGWDEKRPGQWEIFVDGAVYNDWQRAGQTVVFNNPLPIGSRVTIRVTY